MTILNASDLPASLDNLVNKYTELQLRLLNSWLKNASAAKALTEKFKGSLSATQGGKAVVVTWALDAAEMKKLPPCTSEPLMTALVIR